VSVLVCVLDEEHLSEVVYLMVDFHHSKIDCPELKPVEADEKLDES
jgi:hypothetical protein